MKGIGIFRAFAAACLLLSGPEVLFIQAVDLFSAQKPVQHDAAAVIKLVTVRVLDKDGRPVTDLQRDDFVVFDEGKKQRITEFEVHSLGEQGMSVRGDAASGRLGETFTGMNRRMFLYLDIQGSDVEGMSNAKQAALHFIDNQLKPGDEVGVLGFSKMGGFFIKQYLTTDHERIRQAVEQTKEVRASGDAGQDPDQASPPVTTAGETIESVSVTEGAGREHLDNLNIGAGLPPAFMPGSGRFQRRDFVPRMFDLAQAMKYIPGNKSLILFSGRNLGGMAERLGREFAGASLPLYTVNTKNWKMEGIIRLSVKKKHIWWDHPLKDLAAASGGQYFADIEDIETISRDVQLLTGNFYVLGYYVSEKWDGEYHRIKVEVRKPGLKVLAQDGYFNPKPFSEFSDFEKQLHLSDLLSSKGAAKEEAYDLPVEALYLAGEEEANCALVAEMPVDEDAGIPPGRVEVYAYLFDGENNPVVRKRAEVDLVPYKQDILLPYTVENLNAGSYKGRIVIRDLSTGFSAVGRVVFDIPEVGNSDMLLSSPLLLVSGKEPNLLRLTDESGLDKPSLGEFYQYLPEDYRIQIRDLRSGTDSFLMLLPLTFRHGIHSEVEMDLRLRAESGGRKILPPVQILDVVEKDDRTDLLVLEVELEDVDPGGYALEIEVKREEDGAVSIIRKNIWIE